MCATIEEVIWTVIGVCFIGFGISIILDGFFTHPEDN